MIHRKDVARYSGTLTELADDLGDLRYDALSAFLRALAAKLDADGAADAGRGRRKLSAALRNAGVSVAVAATDVERAWSICSPRMEADT
jgi:hypothetical protein